MCTRLRIGGYVFYPGNDIDVDNGVISIRKTIQRIYIVDDGVRRTELIIDAPKTKNSLQDIQMTSDLLRVLKPLKRVVNNEFYGLINNEKHTKPRTYRNYYKSLMKKLDIQDLKFHGLHHSFATQCIEEKCDYKTVSVIIGHSNISTTLNLYVHPNLEQKKKMY